MNFIRARNQDQKNERTSKLLESAIELLEAKNYEEISLTDIAKHSNFTRSNMYKYFKTKEEIYLEILKNETLLWSSEVCRVFDNFNKANGDFSKMWTTILFKYQRLLKLNSILYTILVYNVRVKNLAMYEKIVSKEIQRVVKVLTNVFDDKSEDEIEKFMKIQMSLAIGLYPISFLSTNQKLAIAIYNINYDAIDFLNIFAVTIKKLIDYS